MRYTYCKGCHKPIRAISSFEEAVIKGVLPKKKLKSGCGASGDNNFCNECWLFIKEELQNIVYD